MVQVIEYLPRKHKALSSTLSTMKEKAKGTASQISTTFYPKILEKEEQTKLEASRKNL
jgi:hypothetical protein